MGLSSHLGAKATLGKVPPNMPVPRVPFPELRCGGYWQWTRLSPQCLEGAPDPLQQSPPPQTPGGPEDTMEGPGLDPNSSQDSGCFPKLNSTVRRGESLCVCGFSSKHHPAIRKLKELFVGKPPPRVMHAHLHTAPFCDTECTLWTGVAGPWRLTALAACAVDV